MDNVQAIEEQLVVFKLVGETYGINNRQCP
jgi:hypothetical protein